MHCLMELIGARRLYDYITRVAVRQPPGKTGSRGFISASSVRVWLFSLGKRLKHFSCSEKSRFIYLPGY